MMKKIELLTFLALCFSGIIYSPNLNAKNMKENADSITVKSETIIKSPAKEVFPLACPIMEYKWVKGWKIKLLHCPNGHVEEGCKFQDVLSAPFFRGNWYSRSTWTAVKYDPEKNIVHYQLENNISVSLIKISTISIDSLKSKFVIDLSYKAKTKKGKKHIEKNLKEKMLFQLSVQGEVLRYYCENGKMMEIKEIMDFAKNNDCLTFFDKLNMGLNRIAQAFIIDRYKKMFLKGEPISKTMDSDKNNL